MKKSLKVAESIAVIKNAHQDLIHETKEAIKKTKQDMEVYSSKIKRDLLESVKKELVVITENKAGNY